MPARLHEFHRPEDWVHTHQLLSRPDIPTAPLILGPRPAAILDWPAEAVVELSALALDRIEVVGGETFRLGALATLQSLMESQEIQTVAGGMLAQGARYAAHPGLRRLASVAGAVLSPQSAPEFALALLALDAALVVRGAGQAVRETPLAEFFESGDALSPGDVPIEVAFRIPPGVRLAGALARVARSPMDRAIVAATAVVGAEAGIARDVRLAVFDGSPHPRRVRDAERMLAGHPVAEDGLRAAVREASAQSQPVSDFRASAEYRRAVARVLVRRALADAWRQAK